MKRSGTVLSLFLLLSGYTCWEVDKCLDRGGSWDQEAEHSRFESPRPAAASTDGLRRRLMADR